MGLLYLHNVCIMHNCPLTCENNNEIYSIFTKSEDSIISIVTGLWAGQAIQILAGARIFSRLSILTLGLTQPPLQWVLGFFPRA
jgi:hypothetical protein